MPGNSEEAHSIVVRTVRVLSVRRDGRAANGDDHKLGLGAEDATIFREDVIQTNTAGTKAVLRNEKDHNENVKNEERGRGPRSEIGTRSGDRMRSVVWDVPLARVTSKYSDFTIDQIKSCQAQGIRAGGSKSCALFHVMRQH